MRNTLPKKHILNSKKDIELLFKKGYVLSRGNLRVHIYQTGKSDIPVRVLFSVPKKNHRSAVKRNLIKRRMREAFRINRHDFMHFLKEEKKCLMLALVFTGQNIPAFKEVEKDMQKVLDKLMKPENKP